MDPEPGCFKVLFKPPACWPVWQRQDRAAQASGILVLLPRSPALLSPGSSKTPQLLPQAQEQGRGQPSFAWGWLVGTEPPGLVLLEVGRVGRWNTGEGGRDTKRSR